MILLSDTYSIYSLHTLSGPAGTGKTTSAIAIAKQIYGTTAYKFSTLELNASDERGIDVVRTTVKEFAQSIAFGAGFARDHEVGDLDPKVRQLASKFKIVVLDAADSMTAAAQLALRRIIVRAERLYIVFLQQTTCTDFHFFTEKSQEQFSVNVRFIIICNYAHKIIPAVQSRCTQMRFCKLPKENVVQCINSV